MSGGPVTPSEAADARAKLRMLGKTFNVRGRVSTLMLARAISALVPRFKWAKDIDQAGAIVREFVRDFDALSAANKGQARSIAGAFTPLRRPAWHERIDPKRLTFHIPSVVGNQRIYKDGRVEDIGD